MSSDEGLRLWCETCDGSGHVDETLGSRPPQARADAECSDCDGKGYRSLAITDAMVGRALESWDRTREYMLPSDGLRAALQAALDQP